MGSPLGPVLADIILTELEKIVITPLLDDGTLRFYSRYVDDTLVLIKPEHISLVKDKLNSFHPSLNFTHEEFIDENDVHFLDLKICHNTTTIYRKSTNTGQFVHMNSFEPWNRKTAWVRSLVSRAQRLCSDQSRLNSEYQCINKFLLWNGFPSLTAKKVLSTLKKTFVNGKSTKPRVIDKDVPKIFVRLPFIGKQGELLVKRSLKKIKRLLNTPVRFIVLFDTCKVSTFTSEKDFIPKELRSFVVYEFRCPGCSKSYIGKTERPLLTRLQEHATNTSSEIFSHITTCDDFQYQKSLFELPNCFLDEDIPCSVPGLLLLNTIVIDKARHWNILLYKEAFAIKKNQPSLNTGIKASKELQIF